MKSWTLSLSIEIHAPFLFKSGASLPLGLDAATLVAGDGAALIPGTHLRGHLAHAWEEFASLGTLNRSHKDNWLGSPSEGGKDDKPNRGCLQFDAYWRAEKDGKLRALPRGEWVPLPASQAVLTGDAPIRYRVRIDDKTGTADQGALQLIGQTHSAGQEVTFIGNIHISHMKDSEIKVLKNWLERALAWIPALGALKGIGFGRVQGFKVEHSPAVIADLAPLNDGHHARRSFSFQLDRPYCFGARPLEQNRFESTPFVPGGALRGALFEWCEQVRHTSGEQASVATTILASADHIHLRHAWASKEDRRPAVVPQSALAAASKFLDATEPKYSRPFLVKTAAGEPNEIPSFVIDWKSAQFSKFAELNDWVNPDSWIEVRTAIDASTGSAADEKLFSLDCRMPRSAVHPYRFCTEIALEVDSNDARQTLWTALAQALPHALHHLGKTEARATAWDWKAANLGTTEFTENQRLTITLMSDALLCQFAEADTTTDLLAAYRHHFDVLSCDTLQLETLFADQRLAGGKYFRNRFWKSDPVYHARTLTCAGSVFVFRVADAAKAQTVLQRWLNFGLPSSGPEDWSRNPFLPANGFGEVHLGSTFAAGQIEDQRIIPVVSIDHRA